MTHTDERKQEASRDKGECSREMVRTPFFHSGGEEKSSQIET